MLVCLVRVRGDLFSFLKFFGWCAIHMYFHVYTCRCYIPSYIDTWGVGLSVFDLPVYTQESVMVKHIYHDQLKLASAVAVVPWHSLKLSAVEC